LHCIHQFSVNIIKFVFPINHIFSVEYVGAVEHPGAMKLNSYGGEVVQSRRRS
jgi:hypothetical protein